MKGILQPNQFQLLVIKFAPTQAKTYKETFRCILNNSSSNSLELKVTGIYIPKIFPS